MTESSLPGPKENDRVAIITSRKGFLSADECARVIQIGAQQTSEAGTLDITGEVNTNTRRSRVTYIPQHGSTAWLYQKLGAVVQQVNNEAYAYDLMGIESVQVATYDIGDQYDWHMDLGFGRHSTRKLSLTIQLSSSSDYEGGDLEFSQVNTPPFA